MSKKNKEVTLDFVGIGVEKSASTWLYNCIKEHPETDCPEKKELWYFHYSYDKGSKYLNGYFNEDNKIKGEFTPTYLFYPEALQRIYENNPDMKLICVLRNPAERAYSLWRFGKYRSKTEKRHFIKAIVESQQYYLERGLYSRHLKQLYEIFPKKNVKIILLEDIKHNKHKVIKEIYQFLGLKDYVPKCINKRDNDFSSGRSNILSYMFKFIKFSSMYCRKAGLGLPFDILREKTNLEKKFVRLYKYNSKPTKNDKKIKPQLDEGMRQTLSEYYLNDIKELENMINRDLTLWKPKRNFQNAK